MPTSANRLPSGVAPYLAGPTLGLRATRAEDAAHAVHWLDTPLPVTPAAAAALLDTSETVGWGLSADLRLLAVRLETGEIVGSLRLERQEDRLGRLVTFASPVLAPTERDRVETGIIRIVVPWALDELDLMTVELTIAADRDAVIAAARALGMHESVRIRGAVNRGNHRVDRLMLERINPRYAPVIDRSDES